MDRSLLDYLPPVLQGTRELKAITQAEQAEMEDAWIASDAALDDQFIPTATRNGLTRWERMLGITPRAEDSLDFRRDRLLNRINLQLPFTMGWLYERLNALLGPGNWIVDMDYASYTLYIEADVQSQPYVQEISVTLNTVKPCNLVYINRPLVPGGLLLSEEIQLSSLESNYRLGEWALGEAPFAAESLKGVDKLTSEPSIQPALTVAVAEFIRDRLATARLNGTVEVQALAKAVTGARVVVTYPVTSAQVDTVTQVELLDVDGAVLCSAAVLVPITSDVVFKHTILTKEG